MPALLKYRRGERTALQGFGQRVDVEAPPALALLADACDGKLGPAGSDSPATSGELVQRGTCQRL